MNQIIRKISTSCILKSSKGILLVQESQNGKINWDIPAGGVDGRESVYEGVVREVMEETGIEINSIALKKIYQYIEKEKVTINFLFVAEISEDVYFSPQDSDINDIKWFDISSIEELLENKEYENNLAKKRLEDYSTGFLNELNFEVIME